MPPVLMLPILNQPLILYISATAATLGALLAQQDKTRKERAVYYISRTLVGYELNYTSIEKACLAVVFASQKLHHYMLSHPIKLIAKIDPLKYLLARATLIGRIAKWVMLLSEFDIGYVDRKAIKGQVIVDQLAEAHLYTENPLVLEFPDASIFLIEEHPQWTLYFDGSHTQHGLGVGVIFITPQGDCIPRSYRLSFPCTKNIAEYKALVLGLHIFVQWNILSLKVYGDSQLIINQVNDEYQTKDDKLTHYKRLAEDLKEYFLEISFEKIPRINNRARDAMATIGSLLDIPKNMAKHEFLVEQLLVPSFEVPEFEWVCEIIGPSDSWYHDIFSYLKHEILLDVITPNLKITFVKKTSRFVIIRDTLYCRSTEGTLLHCLNPNKALTTLTEVHNGICGSHSSGLTLAKKLLRIGYYWPTMEKEAHHFVQKCLQCQQHGDLIHAPAQELHPIITPWPFSQWGLDLIGKISPTSSNGHKFIITAIEYFTKWVEAILMTYIMGKKKSKFILNYLIYCYGVPQTLISDNGTPFKNQDV
jgi:ribonuclease HI